MRLSLGLILLIWVGNVTAANDARIGEAIFRAGTGADGTEVQGTRAGGTGVTGLAAACSTCHRRSGLGMVEGRIVIPPVTAKYLFSPHSTNVANAGASAVRTTRVSYTDRTLAQAIREGIDSSGRSLSYLMPRYPLDDSSMTALIAYLRQLDAGAIRGVTDDTLHFATIITPDADPIEKQAMLEVLERFFTDKNSFIRGGARVMKSTREVEYRVSRRWQLHVWELKGPPDTWGAQLEADLEREPVFAVLSGLGRTTWDPVDAFCERKALPCLLPNVNLPHVAAREFYSVYFSRGVLLESDLFAQSLAEERAAGTPTRIVQLYRSDDIGAQAAAALQGTLAALGSSAQLRPLNAGSKSSPQLAAALRDLGADDILILWLRPEDLAALPAELPKLHRVLVSGLMGDLEHAPLPADWRTGVTMSYPFDLPQLRKVRMNFPQGWFRIHGINVRAERVQTDTYTACGILAEALGEMLDSFVPDYLVERIEGMLTHRLTNGYYPRLSLGPGQRFASKGGYLVSFVGAAGSEVTARGEWRVPDSP